MQGRSLFRIKYFRKPLSSRTRAGHKGGFEAEQEVRKRLSIFQTIEQLYREGNDEVREVLTIGLLEGIQNINPHGPALEFDAPPPTDWKLRGAPATQDLAGCRLQIERPDGARLYELSFS